MKDLIRKIFFVKRKFYSYPFSERNLMNELSKIGDSHFFNINKKLRVEIINQEQFELWEKWNYGFRGREIGTSKNACFIGTMIKKNNHLYIEGLIYGNPGATILLYLSSFILITLFFIKDYSILTVSNFANEITIGFIILIFSFLQIYFRRRLEKLVENELNLKLL